MTTDRRLYAQFTLDYADSHKIAPLSDAAFRAHVRMVLWSRRMLTDGKIPGPMAGTFAKPKVIDELLSNDPERPSLTRDERGDYWLHDFLEHQPSRVDVQAKQATNRANGAKGGQARAKRLATESLGDSVSDRGGERVANVYTETKTETETTTTSNEVVVRAPRNAARDTAEAFARFWATYPRRAGKQAAERAFTKALRATPADTILDGATRFANDPNREDEYTPHPATWLNAGRWADDPLPARLNRNRESSLDRRDRQREQMFADIATLTQTGTGPIGVLAP